MLTHSSTLRQELLNDTDFQSNVVWLDSNLGDPAVLGRDGVALAADVAQDGCGVKVDIECLGEVGLRVGEETDLWRAELSA